MSFLLNALIFELHRASHHYWKLYYKLYTLCGKLVQAIAKHSDTTGMYLLNLQAIHHASPRFESSWIIQGPSPFQRFNMLVP